MTHATNLIHAMDAEIINTFKDKASACNVKIQGLQEERVALVTKLNKQNNELNSLSAIYWDEEYTEAMQIFHDFTLQELARLDKNIEQLKHCTNFKDIYNSYEYSVHPEEL